MKQLLWIIILFALAIGVAVATRTYTGNVYLVIEHTMIRVNLHLFVLGLVASVVALYILVRLIAGILSTPDKLNRFGVGRRNRKATQSLNAAGLAYFEGKFQEAQAQADKVLVIGTSMQVYPAAGLLEYAPYEAERYLVDPRPPKGLANISIIEAKAKDGVPPLVEKLIAEAARR